MEMIIAMLNEVLMGELSSDLKSFSSSNFIGCSDENACAVEALFDDVIFTGM